MCFAGGDDALGVSVVGSTSACAANAICGNVTVTTDTVAGSYTDTLKVIANADYIANNIINFTVNTAAIIKIFH